MIETIYETLEFDFEQTLQELETMFGGVEFQNDGFDYDDEEESKSSDDDYNIEMPKRNHRKVQN